MKWGIELEITRLDMSNACQLLRQNGVFCKQWGSPTGMDPKDFFTWHIGSDTTIGANGCELRSPIFQDGRNNIVDVMFVVDVLKKGGASTNHNCGIHIHLSGFTRLPVLQNFAKKSRRKYCMTHGRYTPIRKISDDHVEIRVYNGTLNKRYIARSILECIVPNEN